MKTYLLYDERFMEDEDNAAILESFRAKDDEQAIVLAQKKVTQNGFAAAVTDDKSRYLTFLVPKGN